MSLAHDLVLMSASGARRPSGNFRGGLACAAALLFSILQASCGGAAGNSDPPPAPAASVSVSAPAANVAVNGTVQFSATVQNSSSGVLWQVGTVSGGNSTLGTVTASGLYTAPAAVPNPAAVTIIAVLQSNSSISGSAMLTITLPPPPIVSVSAPVSTMAVNGIVISFAARIAPRFLSRPHESSLAASRHDYGAPAIRSHCFRKRRPDHYRRYAAVDHRNCSTTHGKLARRRHAAIYRASSELELGCELASERHWQRKQQCGNHQFFGPVHRSGKRSLARDGYRQGRAAK
jgi:hypothetical protein